MKFNTNFSFSILTVFVFVIVVTTSPFATVSSVDKTVLPLLVAGTVVSAIVVNLEHKPKYSMDWTKNIENLVYTRNKKKTKRENVCVQSKIDK